MADNGSEWIMAAGANIAIPKPKVFESTFNRIRALSLPTHEDQRGNLTVAEGSAGVPFEIARAFYVYGVTPGATRGGHAHRMTEQLVVPLAGHFQLELTDGVNVARFEMNDPRQGIYIPPLIWDRLFAFSPDAVCLVFASGKYDPADYIRDWDTFLDTVGLPRHARPLS